MMRSIGRRNRSGRHGALVLVAGLLLATGLAAGKPAPPLAPTTHPGWQESGRGPAAETPHRRSAGGFGGWLLVTPDADWEMEWLTPADHTPHFSETDSLAIGEKVTILIFASNAKRDASGRVDVACDIRIRRADGSFAVDEKGIGCLSGQPEGPTHSILLSNVQIEFVGEAKDPVGDWTIEVTLTDRNRLVTLPLRRVVTLTRERMPEKDADRERSAPAKRDEESTPGEPAR